MAQQKGSSPNSVTKRNYSDAPTQSRALTLGSRTKNNVSAMTFGILVQRSKINPYPSSITVAHKLAIAWVSETE